MFKDIVSLVCVAILWGATNPLLKTGSVGIKKIKAKNIIIQFFMEVKYLITNWKYMVPMILNQTGSVLYFITLQNVDLSLSVPVANSLTFVFTAVSGWILGEQPPKLNTCLGILLILTGTTLCCYDKYLIEKKDFKIV